jgi:hypothetical protein
MPVAMKQKVNINASARNNVVLHSAESENVLKKIRILLTVYCSSETEETTSSRFHLRSLHSRHVILFMTGN